MPSFNPKYFVSALVITLALGFGSGFYLAEHQPDHFLTNSFKEVVNRDVGKPDNVDFGLFWQVWNSLHSKYVDKGKFDTQKMINGAISGMVNSVGDPYTVFFEPQISKKFQEEISGSFGGVGLEIGKRNDVLTVIAPLKDTPAFRAGIKTGDKINKINSKSTEGLSVEEAVNQIRGPRGTSVTLTIVSNSSGPKDYTLTRETIKIPAVEWKLIDDHIAYMSIYTFNQNVDAEFKKAAQEILNSKADRLIVDLRNNPGGLLDSAIDLAGWFMDKNSIVTIEDFGGNRNEFRTDGNASLKHLPTVILMNGGSASASEILAGALHDNRDIKLMGDKSYGKGSVQELVSFNNGSSLKVTIAKWLTPNGISISEKGLEPDVKITLDEKAIQSGDIVIGEKGKDPQLDKAIEILR